jgi:hypothetical protein
LQRVIVKKSGTLQMAHQKSQPLWSLRVPFWHLMSEAIFMGVYQHNRDSRIRTVVRSTTSLPRAGFNA